jgi:hypothetical protein
MMARNLLPDNIRGAAYRTPNVGTSGINLGTPREISAVRRLIGGAMRTRTKNPDGFIDGARRDRCAIVAEALR